MHELLDRLGHPERRYPAIHVVGSNGKSTIARMTEALLAAEGLRVGDVPLAARRPLGRADPGGGEEADLEAVVSRVREARRRGRDPVRGLDRGRAPRVRGGGGRRRRRRGGPGRAARRDERPRAQVVVLTNVSLEHTDVLGSTREEIAAEKLAVVREGATVVLGESEWEDAAREAGAARVLVANGNAAWPWPPRARSSAARSIRAPPTPSSLPGRFEVVGTDPLEIWDGAHNPAGLRHLVERLPERDFVVVASILADKDVDDDARGSSREPAAVSSRRNPRNARALPAEELARGAEPYFQDVDVVSDPAAAVALARSLRGCDGILVTGSLYLLASLNAVRSTHVPWGTLATG